MLFLYARAQTTLMVETVSLSEAFPQDPAVSEVTFKLMAHTELVTTFNSHPSCVALAKELTHLGLLGWQQGCRAFHQGDKNRNTRPA